MKQHICCNFENGVCPKNCIHSKPHIPTAKDCILEYDNSVACWIKYPDKTIASYCIPVNEKYLINHVHT